MRKVQSFFQTYFKTALFSVAIGSSFTAQGAMPKVDIQNFSANYTSPRGDAQASNFSFEVNGDVFDFGKNPQFDFYQQGGEFVLRSENAGGHQELRLDTLPQAVYDWRELSVEDIDFNSNSSSLNLNSKRIDYVTNDGQNGYISSIELVCESAKAHSKENNGDETIDSILDLCLNQKMSFYLPFIGGVSVNNINVWANSNTLEFSLKNKVWIKGNGAIFFDKDTQQVRIRVDKAKTGFLNITGKFFREIKAMENDFLKVERPWITIDLPQEIPSVMAY